MALLVAGCAYQPPNAADRARPSFTADLATCETEADKEAHRLVMNRGGLFLSYPIALPIVEARETRQCMDGKGYAASR